jgi:hypothetical protein
VLIAYVEYEGLDEVVRSRVEKLQYEVQDKLVKLTQLRKSIPQVMKDLNRETIESISEVTIDAPFVQTRSYRLCSC